jgi:CopG family nickel-responsive transcriptional regulator
MRKLARVSLALDDELLRRFDKAIREDGFPTRSEPVKRLIAEFLDRRGAKATGQVTGAVMLIYDHHRRNLVNRLLRVQHDFEGLIVASQHIHLDHERCMEVIAVRGAAGKVEQLERRLRGIKDLHVGLHLMADRSHKHHH